MLLGIAALLILILLHVLKPVIIDLDIDFPVRLLLVDFLDDLIADIVVTLDHNKGITKAIEGAPDITLDDSELLKKYLTSLTSVNLLIRSLTKGSVVERGSCPIYNLLYSKEFCAKLR